MLNADHSCQLNNILAEFYPVQVGALKEDIIAF